MCDVLRLKIGVLKNKLKTLQNNYKSFHIHLNTSQDLTFKYLYLNIEIT